MSEEAAVRRTQALLLGVLVAGFAVVAAWVFKVKTPVPYADAQQVIFGKAVASTIVALFAGLNWITMGMVYEKIPAPKGVRRRTLSSVHRWSGRIAVLAGFVVAAMCVATQGPQTSTTRLMVHSLLGGAVFVAVAVKLVIVKRVPAADGLLPLLGSLVFLFFAGLWWTSALPFFQGKI
ncbi:MAG: hypothetical protein HY660_15905 [Armatimonadetes bacterium]|nr:hypothetical protein [Armatimonadota bacterium]